MLLPTLHSLLDPFDEHLSRELDAPAEDLASGCLQWSFAYGDDGTVEAVDYPNGKSLTTEKATVGGDCERVTRYAGDMVSTVCLDRFGRRVAMRDAWGATEYAYDGFARLASVVREGRPQVAYSYDGLSTRVKSMTVADKFEIEFDYDFLGRLARQITPAGEIVYEYRPERGEVVRKLPNGVETHWVFHVSGRLEAIRHSAVGGKLLLGLTYKYLPDGRIGEVTEVSERTTVTVKYGYDEVGQLVACHRNAQPWLRFEYDAAGNRTLLAEEGVPPVKTACDWASRLREFDQRETSHDASGNLASYEVLGDRWRFTYERGALLASAAVGPHEVRYRYDGDGLLIERHADGDSTRFVCDPAATIWRPLLAETGGRTTFYVWEADQPLAAVCDGNPVFFLEDVCGSIRLRIDAHGEIVARHEYPPYGVASAGTRGTGLSFGYAGLCRDDSSGIYLSRHRAYAPQLGRFLQREPESVIPLTAPQDVCAYAYCGNDPVNFTDRSGLKRKPHGLAGPLRLAGQHGGTQERICGLRSLDSRNVVCALSCVRGRSLEELTANPLAHVAIPTHGQYVPLPDVLGGNLSRGWSALRGILCAGIMRIGEEGWDGNRDVFAGLQPSLMQPPIGAGRGGASENHGDEPAGTRSTETKQRASKTPAKRKSPTAKQAKRPPPAPRKDADARFPDAALAPWDAEKIVIHPKLRAAVIKDQILVSLRPDANEEDFIRRLGRLSLGIRVVGRIPAVNMLQLKVDERRADDALAGLGDDPAVVSAGYNFVCKGEREFNDPALTNANMADDWGVQRINAPAAWDHSTGGVLVAVVDSGCKVDHEEFVGKVVDPYSYATSSNVMEMRRIQTPNGEAFVTGHGTHVAGTIAAIADNGLGTAGVAPDSPLMPIQVLHYVKNADGTEDVRGTTAEIVAGICRAIQRGARVVNLSLGTVWDRALVNAYHSGGPAAQAAAAASMAQAVNMDVGNYAAALQLAHDQNAILVKAAGNDSLPARFDTLSSTNRVISVAATTPDDERAAFSNFGPEITVSAPGTRIYSAFADPNRPYTEMKGTSMACPHVTGVVALMLSVDPTLSFDDVRDILVRTARPLATDRPIGPLVDACLAVAEVLRRRGTEVPPCPIPPRRNIPDLPVPPEVSDSFTHVSNPGAVGGVYLAGAGNLLKDLGPVKGVVLGDNDEVILIGKQGDEVKLPDLPLEAVVAIFRGLYEQGEAPWVSIDPIPPNEHVFHRVRQADVSEDNYVGWVIFHCDRVMKGYLTGVENLTRQQMVSNVPGFAETLHGLFDQPVTRDGNSWHRNWFEPNDVLERSARSGRTHLFDIPIRVSTVPTRIGSDGFSPDETRSPSPANLAFAKWFTDHYDEIGREVVLLAPQGAANGGQPVAIYAEMKRLAAIVAVAEVLRGRGTPLPAWMTQYEIPVCDVPDTTPASRAYRLAEDRSVHPLAPKEEPPSGRRHRTRFGGVKLKIKPEAKRVIDNSPEASSIESAVRDVIAAAPLFQAIPFQANGEDYRAVKLPGGKSRVAGACRLAEKDLEIELSGGFRFALQRYYDSFHRPNGEFGGLWTLDLPQLTSSAGYSLRSPLGRLSERFSEGRNVSQWDGNWTVRAPNEPSEFVGLVLANDPRIGRETNRMIAKDGRQWHFDRDTGRLAAHEIAPYSMVYRWQNDRVAQIECWYGNQREDALAFTYDEAGRLESVQADSGACASYTYGADGLLAEVAGPYGTRSYAYRGEFLRSVSVDDKIVRRFDISDGGMLREEVLADGTAVEYECLRNEMGDTEIRAISDGRQIGKTSYDAAFRLKEQMAPAGGSEVWRRLPDDVDSGELTDAAGKTWKVVRNRKDREEVWTTPAGGQYEIAHAWSGGVGAISVDGKKLVERKYRFDGQLAGVRCGTTKIDYRYDEHGAARQWFVSSADREGGEWLEVTPGIRGQIAGIKLSRGYQLGIDRNADGLAKIESSRGSVTLRRDGQDRLVSLETSWGERLDNAYEEEGNDLAESRLTVDGQSASITYSAGRPARVTGFDGSETSFRYAGDELSEVAFANGATLRYQRDESQGTLVVTSAETRIVYGFDDEGRLTSLTYVPVATSSSE